MMNLNSFKNKVICHVALLLFENSLYPAKCAVSRLDDHVCSLSVWPTSSGLFQYKDAGIILGMDLANGRRHYYVIPPPIGRAHTRIIPEDVTLPVLDKQPSYTFKMGISLPGKMVFILKQAPITWTELVCPIGFCLFMSVPLDPSFCADFVVPSILWYCKYHSFATEDVLCIPWLLAWVLFQYKDCLARYRDSHHEDKTAMRQSYFHNGKSHTGETASLYWDNGLVLPCQCIYRWLSARLQ